VGEPKRKKEKKNLAGGGGGGVVWVCAFAWQLSKALDLSQKITEKKKKEKRKG
jgi:hypothetical protein